MLIGTLIIIFLLLLVDIIYENLVFKTRKYKIYSDKIKTAEDDIKLVVLADLHNHVYGNDNDSLIHAINEVNPDIILIAGDMMVAKPNHKMDVSISLIKQLAKRYPIYYALGNHEYRMKIYPEQYKDMYKTFFDAIKSNNIYVLDNTCEKIKIKNTVLNIYGVSIDKEYYQRFVKKSLPDQYMNSLLGEPDSKGYNILLAHNPNYFKEYVKWGADLTLAGHIHGGLINVPFLGGLVSPQVEFFPKYDGGLFKEKDKIMILSRGLGTHTINVRVNNKAELVSIRLKARV